MNPNSKKRTIVEEIVFRQNKRQKLSSEKLSKSTLVERIALFQQGYAYSLNNKKTY